MACDVSPFKFSSIGRENCAVLHLSEPLKSQFAKVCALRAFVFNSLHVKAVISNILSFIFTSYFRMMKERGLDAAELLTASAYKEMYRAQMIVWGEERRNADPGIFCRLACLSADRSPSPTWPIWVVADARRPTDVSYFQVNQRGREGENGREREKDIQRKKNKERKKEKERER